MEGRRRRGVKGFNITSLPYVAKVYSNNQVLIPAQLVRSLGIQNETYAIIKFEYENHQEAIKAKLLKTKYTDSRQFTIPKEVRERLGITPGKTIKIISITGAH